MLEFIQIYKIPSYIGSVTTVCRSEACYQPLRPTLMFILGDFTIRFCNEIERKYNNGKGLISSLKLD